MASKADKLSVHSALTKLIVDLQEESGLAVSTTPSMTDVLGNITSATTIPIEIGIATVEKKISSELKRADTKTSMQATVTSSYFETPSIIVRSESTGSADFTVAQAKLTRNTSLRLASISELDKVDSKQQTTLEEKEKIAVRLHQRNLALKDRLRRLESEEKRLHSLISSKYHLGFFFLDFIKQSEKEDLLRVASMQQKAEFRGSRASNGVIEKSPSTGDLGSQEDLSESPGSMRKYMPKVASVLVRTNSKRSASAGTFGPVEGGTETSIGRVSSFGSMESIASLDVSKPTSPTVSQSVTQNFNTTIPQSPISPTSTTSPISVDLKSPDEMSRSSVSSSYSRSRQGGYKLARAPSITERVPEDAAEGENVRRLKSDIQQKEVATETTPKNDTTQVKLLTVSDEKKQEASSANDALKRANTSESIGQSIIDNYTNLKSEGSKKEPQQIVQPQPQQLLRTAAENLSRKAEEPKTAVESTIRRANSERVSTAQKQTSGVNSASPLASKPVASLRITTERDMQRSSSQSSVRIHDSRTDSASDLSTPIFTSPNMLESPKTPFTAPVHVTQSADRAISQKTRPASQSFSANDYTRLIYKQLLQGEEQNSQTASGTRHSRVLQELENQKIVSRLAAKFEVKAQSPEPHALRSPRGGSTSSLLGASSSQTSLNRSRTLINRPNEASSDKLNANYAPVSEKLSTYNAPRQSPYSEKRIQSDKPRPAIVSPKPVVLSHSRLSTNSSK